MSKLAETYPVGTTLDCVVTRVETFGVFVRLPGDAQVTGFIRPRDWSWSRRIFDIEASVEPGLPIRAQVLGHASNKKLELSRRLEMPDPFPAFVERHRVGDVVLGQVTLVAKNDTGVILTLEGGVEGFVPRSEIPHIASQEEGFGLLAQDSVAAAVTGYQRKQVRLSVKEHLHRRESAAERDVEAERSALRFHPTFGASLENMRLNLELDESPEPEIRPEVREAIRRILVVEDSVNVSESLEMIFDHFGFPCDLATSVDEADKLLAKNTYELLILDVNLPATSGVELVRRLEAESTEAFLFVLTAARAADWSELIGTDPDRTTCFFQKPTSFVRLFGELTRLVLGEEVRDDRVHQAGLDPSASPKVPTAVRGGYRERVDAALATLAAATYASRAFVLSFRPGPHFDLVGGELAGLTREVQQELDISPVGDVIRQHRFLAVDDVEGQSRRFKHLLKVYPVGSFAGLALGYSDRAEYGLFLFGEKPHQLTGATEDRLRAAGQLIEHYITEDRLDQVITENQGLLLTGFLSDSLLHEIKNEVQALDDYAAVQVLIGKKHKDGLASLGQDQALELKRSMLGIQSVSRRLGELILLFRNLAGHPPEETLDLNRAIERLVQTVKPFAESYDVAVRTELDPAVPALRASPKLIDQPFLNIMINGVEQMGRTGGRRRRLVVTSRYRAGEPYPVEVTIRDNGHGIHHVHREKIFDLFFTTKASGTGLGLYISRYFVEQLGGRLLLRESVMFSGSEFAVELPASALA